MIVNVSDAPANVRALLADHAAVDLDIGCGANKQPGFIGMDIRPLPGVDIVHDVEVYPWPLPNDCVRRAVCSHLVEHINPHKGNFIKFMNEIWRVMKVGGELMIATPHGYSPGYLQDPTHCNPCNEWTWAYFDPAEKQTDGYLYNIYRPKPWRIKYLSFNPNANIELVLVKRKDDDDEQPG